MSKKETYPNIDMQKTGKNMKQMLESAGYTPRMIQDYLHLSCVQPIYRWYKGKILPSVDNLLMLSMLLDVHMDEFLVRKNEERMIILFDIDDVSEKYQRGKCLLTYYNRIMPLIA